MGHREGPKLKGEAALSAIMRSKIERLYGEMRSVESIMEVQAHELDARAMMAKIDQLEQRAIHLQIPTAYGSSLYTMRVHIWTNSLTS